MSREHEPSDTTIYCVHEADDVDADYPVGPPIAAFRSLEDAKAFVNELERPYREYRAALEKHEAANRAFAEAVAKLDAPASNVHAHNQDVVYAWIKWARPDVDIPEPTERPRFVDCQTYHIAQVSLRGGVGPDGANPPPL